MALKVDADALALGEPLFGVGEFARGLMLDHKVAVSACLLSLVEGEEEGEEESEVKSEVKSEDGQGQSCEPD
jgi:hypothetical protein